MNTTTKRVTMHHAVSGHTIEVFESTLPSRAWFADDSSQDELEWLGGEKSARDFISRRLHGGFARVA